MLDGRTAVFLSCMDAFADQLARPVRDRASTKPVELPDDERVAFPEDVERFLKPWTISNPSAGRVVEDLLAS